MTAWTWSALVFASGLLFAAFTNLARAEIEGWLDLAPRALLRLAAAQLSPTQRLTIYTEEWLPELCYIMHEAEGRPLTRLVRGTSYALGLLITARRIARRVNRTPVTASATRRPRMLLFRQVLAAVGTTGFAGLGCYFAAEALALSQDATIVCAALFLAILAGGVLALGFYRERDKRIWYLLATLLGGFIITLGILRYWLLAVVEGAGLASVVSASLPTVTIAALVFCGYVQLRSAHARQFSHARQTMSANTTVTAVDKERRLVLLARLVLVPVTAVPVGCGCYLAAQGLGEAPDATIAWAALFLVVLAGGVLALGFYRERDKRIWYLLATLLGGFIITLGILRYWLMANIGAATLVPAVADACVVTAIIGIFVFFAYLGRQFAESRRPATMLAEPTTGTPPITSGPDR